MDIRYVAGIFDGEGNIYIKGTNIQANVSNTNWKLITELIKKFGGGISEFTREEPHHKRCWLWRVCGDNAEDFLRKIEPYLIIKKKKAKKAIKVRAGRV